MTLLIRLLQSEGCEYFRVRAAINNGEDVNEKNEHGFSPLHFAPSLLIAEMLIEHGAAPDAPSKHGATPLYYAQTAGIAQLLINHGANPNAVCEYGYTPIFVAQNEEIAKVLIDAGADINTKRGEYNIAPLHNIDDADVVQRLINAGADVNARDKNGFTPLDVAQAESIIMVLRSAGGKSGKELNTTMQNGVQVDSQAQSENKARG